MNYLDTVCAQLKLDAKYTAFFARQLEYIKSRTYDVVYPEHKARILIPVSNEADPAAETITYRQWDGFGQAIVIANYADDLPVINTLAEEFFQKVVGLGDAYTWSIMDIRRSQMAGSNLNMRQAMWARRAQENAVEELGAKGDDRTGLTGFGNNANVTITAPTTGDWTNAATSGMEIVEDLMKMEREFVVNNLETFLPDTIAMDTECFMTASTKITSVTGDSGKTALKYYLDSSPHIKNIESWVKLSDMSAGSKARIVMYKRDPEVLTLEIPQEYEEFPPQAKGLSFEISTHMRVGGVIVYYALGMLYMDGCIV